MEGIDNAGEIIGLIRPGGVVGALAAVAVAIIGIRFINSATTRFSVRFTERRLLAQQLNTILRFLIYLGAIAVVLTSLLSLEKEALLALSGVIAFTVGFALKDLASSVLAGITILFDRPFQVGDRVSVAGVYGEITNIGLRSVRLQTLDDSMVTIPNNRFLTEIVTSGNAGALDMQIVMDFFIAVDADLGLAKRLTYEAVRTSRFVYLDKPVVVLVNDVMQSHYMATRIRAKAYVLDVRYEKAFESDVTERLKLALRSARIKPPGFLQTADVVETQAPGGP